MTDDTSRRFTRLEERVSVLEGFAVDLEERRKAWREFLAMSHHLRLIVADWDYRTQRRKERADELKSRYLWAGVISVAVVVLTTLAGAILQIVHAFGVHL